MQYERFIRLPEVSDMTGISRSKIYEMIADPDDCPAPFPRPVKMGRKSVWCQTEVQAWIETVKARRQTNPQTA